MVLPVLIVLAVIAGLAARGSLRPFGDLHIHWWGAAIVGLMLQALPTSWIHGRAAATVVLAVSYAILIATLWVNRRLPGFWLALIGIVLNLAVILPNDGMPVSGAAARVAGGSAASIPVDGAANKHHLMTDQDVLRPLGDVIPVPPPLSDLLSVGDVLLYAGVAYFIVMVMLGRSGANRRPPARMMRRYRGKHLPDQEALRRRADPRPEATGSPVATRSGT